MTKIFSLKGKVAIITGASRGIGASICSGFHEAGAIVFGVSRSSPSAKEEFGYYAIDITKKNDLIDLVDEVVKLAGHIDVIVNCAGITLPPADSNQPIPNIQKLLDTNLLAAHNLTEAVLPTMVKRQKGSIINVTSIGSHLAFPGNPGYLMSKAALSALTRSIAIDFGTYGIRANNIVPGYIQTEMTRASYIDKYQHQRRKQRTILDRWGVPSDLIGPAIFLASDASSYITGQDIVVDGGWTVKGL